MVKGHAWQRWACVAKGGMGGERGMYDRGMFGKGACMVKDVVHGGGMEKGGMHGERECVCRGHAWQGTCMTGDMHGRGCA